MSFIPALKAHLNYCSTDPTLRSQSEEKYAKYAESILRNNSSANTLHLSLKKTVTAEEVLPPQLIDTICKMFQQALDSEQKHPPSLESRIVSSK